MGVQRAGMDGASAWDVPTVWGGCVPTHHQVGLQALVELQGGDVVGLLQVVDHEQLSVLQTARTLKEPLQTLLQRHTLRYRTMHHIMECVKGPGWTCCSVGGQNSPGIHNHTSLKCNTYLNLINPHSATINGSFT